MLQFAEACEARAHHCGNHTHVLLDVHCLFQERRCSHQPSRTHPPPFIWPCSSNALASLATCAACARSCHHIGISCFCSLRSRRHLRPLRRPRDHRHCCRLRCRFCIRCRRRRRRLCCLLPAAEHALPPRLAQGRPPAPQQRQPRPPSWLPPLWESNSTRNAFLAASSARAFLPSHGLRCPQSLCCLSKRL